jgi:hypothetical protein
MHAAANPLVGPHARAALLAALLCIAPPVAAGVYKCEGDDGKPIYQDSPCPKGTALRDFDQDPPTLTILPSPPGTATLPKAPPLPEPRRKIVTGPKPKKDVGSGNPAERKFLAPGIAEGEVVARVGPPDIRTSGNGKSSRWTYLPVPEDPQTVTTLRFQGGRLVEVERRIVR